MQVSSWAVGLQNELGNFSILACFLPRCKEHLEDCLSPAAGHRTAPGRHLLTSQCWRDNPCHSALLNHHILPIAMQQGGPGEAQSEEEEGLCLSVNIHWGHSALPQTVTPAVSQVRRAGCQAEVPGRGQFWARSNFFPICSVSGAVTELPHCKTNWFTGVYALNCHTFLWTPHRLFSYGGFRRQCCLNTAPISTPLCGGIFHSVG